MFPLFNFRSITPSHIDSVLRLPSWTSWHRDELILAAAAVGLVIGICVGTIGAAVVLHQLSWRKATSTDSVSPISVSVHQSVNAAKHPSTVHECAFASAGLDTSLPSSRDARLRRGGRAVA